MISSQKEKTTMQKKTAKQQKKVQKMGRNESFAEYLNFLMSGQVESEEQANRINKLAKKTVTFAEAAAISKILVAQIDHKLSQVMEAVQVQQIVLEKLEVTEEMFQEAQEQYDKKLEAVQQAMEQIGKAPEQEEVPNYGGTSPDEEFSMDNALEELKEQLEANDAESHDLTEFKEEWNKTTEGLSGAWSEVKATEED